MNTTPTLKFVRQVRDCPANQDPKTKRKIIDYAVLKDGAHTTTFKSFCYSRGYELVANLPNRHHPIAREEKRQTHVVKHPVKAESQKEFERVIREADAEGLIPSFAGLQEIEASLVAKVREQQEATAAVQHRATVESRGEELLMTLRHVLEKLDSEHGATEPEIRQGHPECFPQIQKARDLVAELTPKKTS